LAKCLEISNVSLGTAFCVQNEIFSSNSTMIGGFSEAPPRHSKCGVLSALRISERCLKWPFCSWGKIFLDHRPLVFEIKIKMVPWLTCVSYVNQWRCVFIYHLMLSATFEFLKYLHRGENIMSLWLYQLSYKNNNLFI